MKREDIFIRIEEEQRTKIIYVLDVEMKSHDVKVHDVPMKKVN